MRGRRLVFAAIATVLLVWLMRTAPPPRLLYPIREPRPTTELGGAFDPARCGTVRGKVGWSGDVPAVPPIELLTVRNPPAAKPRVPNPNAPRITDGLLADAVVYLVGIDTARSGPWRLPPASVEVTRMGLVVKQGATPAGWRSSGVPTRSNWFPGKKSIRRPGSSSFTRSAAAGPHSSHKCYRRRAAPSAGSFPEPGVVELTSGSGYYWLRGYLFVSDHPYAAVTGPDGGFDFVQVPDGEYEAVCRVANWHVERTENDPEWSGPVRLFFKPAVEKRQRVTVSAGKVGELQFAISAADFDRAPQVR